MILPLKKTLSVTITLIALILAGMLALGLRQYQLHQEHQKIVRQTERLLFQFALIREHVIESMVSGRPEGLVPVSRQVELLQAGVSRVLENTAIPDEYKMTFANQVDLAGLLLLLRDSQTQPLVPEKIRQLNRETRTLGERLRVFDRLVMGYAKRQVIDFQTAVIGVLALAIVGLIGILLSGYRRMAVPLFGLVPQIRKARKNRAALSARSSWSEVKALAAATQELLEDLREAEETRSRQEHLLLMTRHLLLSVPRAGDSEQLYRRASKALLTNPEYCLVWLGVSDRQGDLLPVAADGSTTMTGKECRECMAVLLSEAEEQGGEQDQALSALRSAEPVIRRDILAGLPKGPFKNTPLAEGKVNCASLPIGFGEQILGVLNLYSLEPDSFGQAELALLECLCGFLAREAIRLQARPEAPAGQDPAGGTGKMALEVNNMSNGIINYAQLLTDELDSLDAATQTELLAKIIQEGERIASLMQPFLFYNQGRKRKGAGRG